MKFTFILVITYDLDIYIFDYYTTTKNISLVMYNIFKYFANIPILLL